MTATEMEQQLENLDHRLARIEQILPTLAAKADLERFATKADLAEGLAQQRAFTESVRDEVRRVAERQGVLAERQGVLAEGQGVLAEGQANLVVTVAAIQYTLDALVTRLEVKGVI